MYTEAAEDYLKNIYEIQNEHDKVATTELAKRLGVASASVTNMVKKLAEFDLVDYEPYRGVILTPAGRNVALQVIRHHRLVESFLEQALGLPWDQVHEEAERLEHVLSEELEARIDVFLDRPAVDPHGAPIPTYDGQIAPSTNVRLADVETGKNAVVTEVNDRDPALLRYLGEMGLYPGVAVQVISRAPFSGPLSLQVGASEVVLGNQAASHILVTNITAVGTKKTKSMEGTKGNKMEGKD